MIWSPAIGQEREKIYMDELSVDESPTDHFEYLKVNVYFCILDSLATQLHDHFSEESLTTIKAIRHFTHFGLPDIPNKRKEVKPEA